MHALLTTLRASGEHAARARDGLSPRLAPVLGKRLWEDPWLQRFREAGRYAPFQAAQNQVANDLWIEPMLPFARGFGLDSARALLLVIDRAVQMGPASAQRWLAEVLDPAPTPAQQQQALAALGHAELKAFQAANGLKAEGQRDPMTIAVLVGALRQSGRSPVPLRDAREMEATVQRRAQGTPWEGRMRRLAETPMPGTSYRI